MIQPDSIVIPMYNHRNRLNQADTELGIIRIVLPSSVHALTCPHITLFKSPVNPATLHINNYALSFLILALEFYILSMLTAAFVLAPPLPSFTGTCLTSSQAKSTPWHNIALIWTMMCLKMICCDYKLNDWIQLLQPVRTIDEIKNGAFRLSHQTQLDDYFCSGQNCCPGDGRAKHLTIPSNHFPTLAP